MNQAKQLREKTRILECHLGNINKTDSCCCGISEPECFVLVEIGRKPNIFSDMCTDKNIKYS